MLWDEEMHFLKSSLLGCSFKVLIRGIIFRVFLLFFCGGKFVPHLLVSGELLLQVV